MSTAELPVVESAANSRYETNKDGTSGNDKKMCHRFSYGGSPQHLRIAEVPNKRIEEHNGYPIIEE
jgi:hypothetical protein